MTPLEARTRAIDVYQERAKAARHWRLIALFLTIAVAVLAVVCGTLAHQYKIVPYVVQVDRQGYEVALGPLHSSQATDERIIMARLARFIQAWRSVTIDPEVSKQNIQWLYTSIAAGSDAQSTVDQWYKDHDLYAAVQSGETVVVDVTSVLRASDTSAGTWRVEWRERNVSGGKLLKTTTWTGLMTVGITPPKDMALVIKNPLGIYVTHISASPDLTSITKE